MASWSAFDSSSEHAALAGVANLTSESEGLVLREDGIGESIVVSSAASMCVTLEVFWARRRSASVGRVE